VRLVAQPNLSELSSFCTLGEKYISHTMKEANFNTSVAAYKRQLEVGDIQVAYAGLIKFVARLKTRFSKTLKKRFSFGAIFQGYMDYTYFYFSNSFCRERKLKFGLVLNHEDMRFEIWLLGRTKDIQERYWHLLKGTEWIQGEAVPKYSIFEHILIESPDFSDLDTLSTTIEEAIVSTTNRIFGSLDQIEKDTSRTGQRSQLIPESRPILSRLAPGMGRATGSRG
jgi:hypothetical protein